MTVIKEISTKNANQKLLREASPVNYTLGLIEGRWKLAILLQLSTNTIMRFGELCRNLQPVTDKMLTQQLKALEKDGLITRTQHAGIFPRVIDYQLSKQGQALQPILESMRTWGINKLEDDRELGKA